MSELTEAEIFSCLSENFKLAAEHCDQLAWAPMKGPVYEKLREELKLIEGASLQVAYWRMDARWLAIGACAAEAHKRAGDWLRKFFPAPLFLKLADNLRKGHVLAEQYRTAKTGHTGHMGALLPEPPAETRTQGRPVQVLLPADSGACMTPGGILIP